MDNKIIFISCIVILLFPTVNAITSTDLDLILYLNMDDAAAPLADSKSNSLPTFTYNVAAGGGTYQQTGLAGYSTYSINFNADTRYVNLSTDDYYHYKDYSICAWETNDVAVPAASNAVIVGNRINDGGLKGFFLWQTDESSKTLNCRFYDGGAQIDAYSSSAAIYAHVCCVANSSGVSIWVNGTLEAYTAHEWTTSTHGGDIYVGSDAAGSFPWDGNIDEVVIFNRTLSSSDIYAVYSTGISTGLPGTPNAPVIVNPSPSDNSHENTNQTLNVTHTSGLNDVRYYLYFSTSSTLTESSLIIVNDTRTGYEYKQYTTNLTDGTYYWKWKVQNITNGLFSSNTTQRTLVIDTANPTISIFDNTTFSTSNTTIISNLFTKNIWYNVSFYDSNLYQTLINVTNSSGDSMYSFLNNTITGNFANYSRNVSIEYWPLGNYTFKFAAVDSHTAQQIPDYQVDKSASYLFFHTTEGNEIKVSSITPPSKLSSTKLIDRYNFNFEYDISLNSYEYIIQSNNKISYISNSDYPAHFVVISDKGGNWIDFGGVNKKDAEVIKIDDYNYKVIITSNGIQKFTFNSLGGLNLVEKHYLVKIGSYINISAYDPIINQSLVFTSILDGVSKNSDAVTNQTNYGNITYGYHDLTIYSDGYVDSHSIIFVNYTRQNFTINMYKQNILGSCDLYPITLMTFKGLDEEKNIDVNMSLDITLFHSPFDNISVTNNQSFSFSGSYNYSICTDTYNTFNISSIMEYGDGTLYSKRKYYLNDHIANASVINNVYLYHLNNTKTSEIIFTAYDQLTGDKVTDAYIKILRYYPGENVYKIVEITQTDEHGQTIGKMVLADVFYKFIIEKPAGFIRLSSDVLRILSLTRSFSLDFTTDYLSTWDKVHDVSISTTCTKGTQTCRTTWSDSSNIVQDVTMMVYRTNGISETLLDTQTSSASSGSITYVIPETTEGNTYTAKSYIKSNTEEATYLGQIAQISYPSNPFFTSQTHRIASLLPLLLLIVVIVFVLIDFGVVGVILAMMMGLIIGKFTGIFPLSPMYFTSFIIMAIILIYRLLK